MLIRQMSHPIQVLTSIATLTSDAARQREQRLFLFAFTPEVVDSADIAEKIQEDSQRYEEVSEEKLYIRFLWAIANRHSNVWDILAIIFEDKSRLVRLLIQAAIFLVGDQDLRVPNRVMDEAREDMTAETALLCTRLMLDATKWPVYAVEVLYQLPVDPEWNLQEIIYTTGVRLSYHKLSLCEKRYWSFPLFLQRLREKVPKIGTTLRQVATMPTLLPADVKIARQIRERSESNKRDV